MRPPLYILAGGKSRRFGSDKARAIHRGRPLILTVADALAPATVGSTVVAAASGRYADLGLQTIADRWPDRGPLGGLASALADLPDRHPGSQWLVLAACDLLDPDPDWVASLVAAAIGMQAAAFRSETGWEPVCAVYHADLREEAQRRAMGDDRSMHALLDAVDTASLPVPRDYRQVTRPEDLPG